MTRRFTTTLSAVATAVPLAVTGIGLASPRAADAQQQPPANASVVHVDRIVPPRRKVVHHKFRPWARPTPRQVRSIIRAEARRWRIDPRRLANRVACESRFRWWASNGTYQGVLQF